MQAPGWTVAILPLALSMLASDTGSSAGAQPSIEEEEREGHIFPLCPLDTSNKRRCLTDIWKEGMKSKCEKNPCTYCISYTFAACHQRLRENESDRRSDQ